MKQIKEFIFGVRAKGETLPTPTFKTTDVVNKLSEDEWAKYVKFGSRYGYKGSFYNNQNYEKNRLYQISQQETCSRNSI